MERVPRKWSGMELAVFVFGLCFVAGPAAWAGVPPQAGEVGPQQASVRHATAKNQGKSAWQQWKETYAELNRRGVSVSGWVQMDGSTVPKGGQPNPDAFLGQYLIDLALTVDTNKLLHLPGGTLTVEGQTHSGANILEKQLPAIQDPNNMDAPPGTWLATLMYQQNLMHDKVQAQAGLMYVDSLFLTVPYGGNFVSLDFSSDGSISTFVLPTYPKGSWGGDVTVAPLKGLTFSGGVYNNHSTELEYDPGGNLWITEEAWQGQRHGRPYKLQVGAWRDTGLFQRFQGGTVHHASGMYLVASDKLWQPKGASDRGVGMFFQYGAGPASVAVVHHHVGAGVVWDGPFGARPKDEVGLAFSDAILTKQSVFTHGFENEEELYYQFHVAHGFTVMPDVQLWQHPNGGGTPNSLLMIVRAMYSF